MSTRQLILAGLAAALCIGASPLAFAGEFKPISMPAFQEAAAKNRPIILHVRTADGALCKAQHAVLEKLMTEPAYADYVVFEIDFLTQPAAVAMTRAKTPATLIFHRGPAEVGRITGITEEAPIRALLGKAAG